jgi:hypothetical protein
MTHRYASYGILTVLIVSACSAYHSGTDDLGQTLSQGTATLTGDPLFAARDAIGGTNPGPFVDGPWASLCTRYTQVYISDLANSCAEHVVLAPHAIMLTLVRDAALADASVQAPATFDVTLPRSSGRNMAFVSYGSVNPNGGGSVIFAKSGTVTVSEVSAQGISGTFYVTTQDNHIAGSFSAAICSPWMRSDNIPGPITCLQSDGGV